MDTSREGAIRGGRAGRLSSLSRLFYPLTCYRIYNIEYSQFMSGWRFLEMGIHLLDENRLRLFHAADH